MPRFRAEIVLYFDADDMRIVPRRLQELNAAVATVGFDFHRGKAARAEPEQADDGWTRYASIPDPPA